MLSDRGFDKYEKGILTLETEAWALCLQQCPGGKCPKVLSAYSGLASSRCGQKGLRINFVLITLPFPGLHFHFTPGAALVTDAQTTEKDGPQVVAFWGDSLYIRN